MYLLTLDREREREGEAPTNFTSLCGNNYGESLVSFQFAIWLVAATGKLMSAQQINSATLQRCFARVATLQVTFKINTHTHTLICFRTMVTHFTNSITLKAKKVKAQAGDSAHKRKNSSRISAVKLKTANTYNFCRKVSKHLLCRFLF